MHSLSPFFVDNLWKMALGAFFPYKIQACTLAFIFFSCYSNKVKKLAKLALFFSLSFAILFLVSTGMRFLAIRLEWVRALSLQQEAVLVALIAAARWALSLTIYSSILLGLGYIARKAIFAPFGILSIALLTLGFTFGIDLGLKNWENVPPASTPVQPLGGPGLILANTTRPTDTVLVLLQGPTEPGGKRVVATPGKPLLYQEEVIIRDQQLIDLPPAPFNTNSPWSLRSMAIDLRLNAEMLQQRLSEGILPFVLYTGTLIFLLSSLLFVFKMSAWPLAGLMLGCFAYRGILALETFLNSPEMLETFDAFLQNRVPVALVFPLICTLFGILIHLYSFLVYLAKRRDNYAV